jgi:dTDP-4-dehydrorhamnose reductase
VDAAENEKEKAFKINAEGARNLALICSSLSIPMFHISTDYVFDGETKESYKETDLPSPHGIYAKSKLIGENFVREILDEYIILRISWVFGRYGNNFVKTILRLAREKEELRVVSDQRGCPTPAQDVAWVMGVLAEHYFHKNELPWGTFHYVGRPDTTWYHLAKAILEESYALEILEKMPALLPITTEEYPTPAKRPQNSILNCNKIYKTFGIKSRPWRLGLVETLKEIKKKMP